MHDTLGVGEVLLLWSIRGYQSKVVSQVLVNGLECIAIDTSIDSACKLGKSSRDELIDTS